MKKEPNALERFRIAVEGMATSASPIQVRLSNAYTSIAVFLEADIPAEHRVRYRALLARCAIVRVADAAPLHELDAMPNEHAEAVAADIWAIFDALVRQWAADVDPEKK
jgi:hypothetical protein